MQCEAEPQGNPHRIRKTPSKSGSPWIIRNCLEQRNKIQTACKRFRILLLVPPVLKGLVVWRIYIQLVISNQTLCPKQPGSPKKWILTTPRSTSLVLRYLWPRLGLEHDTKIPCTLSKRKNARGEQGDRSLEDRFDQVVAWLVRKERWGEWRLGFSFLLLILP